MKSMAFAVSLLIVVLAGCQTTGPVVVQDPFCSVAPVPQGVVDEALLMAVETETPTDNVVKLTGYVRDDNAWMRRYQNLHDRMGCEN